MKDINRVCLLGRIGLPPEIKQLPSGRRVCNIVMATNEKRKDREGSEVSFTEWHKVSVYVEHIIDQIQEDAKKGDTLYVEGSLETNNWIGRDGVARSTTTVCVRPYSGTVLLSRHHSNKTERTGKTDAKASMLADARKKYAEEPIPDDDIPF